MDSPRGLTTPLLLAERFWAKVEKVPFETCWLWTGTTSGGYGRFVAHGRRRVAAQVAWELANGQPFPSEMACHHCDNPPCVNPDHIFPGTQTDNMRDAVRKGRRVGPPPKTHCPYGHPYVVLRRRSRCRACGQEATRKWRMRRKP